MQFLNSDAHTWIQAITRWGQKELVHAEHRVITLFKQGGVGVSGWMKGMAGEILSTQ